MENDTRLSYSSSTLLKNCSQKYYHHKVAKTPRDTDAEQNMEAFNVGKAFHHVLEMNNHSEDRLEELLREACKSFEVPEFEGMIHAMLLRYLQVHKNSGLEVVHCELELSNEIFLGFIDVILKNPETGEWWIGDLKTAGRINDTTFARLKNDTQLNLYSSFADKIAPHLNLDPKKFAGARYRVTSKSKLTRKADESYNAHVRRTAKNVKSYDVIIPLSMMNPKGVYDEHKKLHAKTMKLRKGTLKPEKNMSYCDSFFRPCEFWSQCYGSNFTKSKDSLEVIGSNNV